MLPVLFHTFFYISSERLERTPVGEKNANLWRRDARERQKVRGERETEGERDRERETETERDRQTQTDRETEERQREIGRER